MLAPDSGTTSQALSPAHSDVSFEFDALEAAEDNIRIQERIHVIEMKLASMKPGPMMPTRNYGIMTPPTHQRTHRDQTSQRSEQAFHYGSGAKDSRDETSPRPQGRQEEEEPENRPVRSTQMEDAMAYLDTFANGVDEKYQKLCDEQKAMILQLGDPCSMRTLDKALEEIRAVQQVSVTLANGTSKAAREHALLIDNSAAEIQELSEASDPQQLRMDKWQKDVNVLEVMAREQPQLIDYSVGGAKDFTENSKQQTIMMDQIAEGRSRARRDHRVLQDSDQQAWRDS